MKKTLLSIMAIACTMLAACNIPQIKRADVSFEGLKTFYVDSPKNGAEIFAKFGNAEQTNSIIVEEVAANLQSKGYVRVVKREEAQMIFVPVWSVSIQSFDDVSDTANIVIAQNSAFTNSDFNSLDTRNSGVFAGRPALGLARLFAHTDKGGQHNARNA